MAMPILSLPVVVYVALLVAIVLLFVRRRGLMRGERRRVARTVWCPVKDRTLSAELVETVWEGRRLDVAECAAFSPPTAVTCEKACLRLTERPRPAPRGSILPIF
jgi:hypothetical protein